jgi:hypothetical protein
MASKTAAFILLFTVCATAAPTPPPGFSYPDPEMSPSLAYGFCVPNDDLAPDLLAKAKNSLVDMKSGAVIAVIDAPVGFAHMSNGGVDAPWWAKDESAVLWKVDGKWGPQALVLIEVEAGKQKAQIDVLKVVQKEILAQTKAAQPAIYAAAAKQNAANASEYYPDGFTIDVEPVKPDADEPGNEPPLAFPIKFHANLDSNPKQIENYPKEAEISTEVDGELSADGTFKVTKFDVVQN